MKRDQQMKFKVSEEEKQQIESNAKAAGFANAASYMRHQCLNRNQSGLCIYEKCEIRDSLQKIREWSGNNPKVITHTNRINSIIDKAGEE